MPLTQEHRDAQAKLNVERSQFLDRVMYETSRMSGRIFARRLLDEVLNPAQAVALLLPRTPPRPLTRWERVKRRLEAYRERVVTAWRVLRGDDIHEDCY